MIANLSVRHFDVPISPSSYPYRLIGPGMSRTSAFLEKIYLGVADDAKSILVGLLLKTAAQVLFLCSYFLLLTHIWVVYS